MAVQLQVNMDLYDAQVQLETLWQATEMVRKGAITSSIMKTSFAISNKNFNKYMLALAIKQSASGEPGIRHMFDFGATYRSVGNRLWQTWMSGGGKNRIVEVAFIDSTRKVVQHPSVAKIVKRKYVFQKKARMLENAEMVTIPPKKAKVLVYDVDNQSPEQQRNGKAKGVVFTKIPSGPMPAGMGENKNNFQQVFVTWWASVGQENLADAARLASLEFEKSFAFRKARVAAANTRINTQRAHLKNKDATPEAKRRAKEMILAIERQMSKYSKGASRK